MCGHLKTISISLLLFLIFLPSLALSQTAVGKFTFVQGRVDVLRQPAPRAVPVKMGNAVFVGDIIRAKSASKAEITFNDGNIVRVAPNTRVEISEYMFDEAKGKGILKLSRGKVQTIIQEKIAKRIAAFGEANRFEIHTPTAIAGARGCNFIVSFQRNSSSVLVIEGTILTYNPKFPDMAVTVNAGYVTTIPLNQPAQPARPFTDAEKKLHEGDFAKTGEPGKTSEAEDTVISEATTGPAEPGAPSGPESLTPMGTLTEIVQPPPITETVGSDTTPPVINITGPPDLSNLPVSSFNVTSDETVTFTYQMESWGAISPNTTSDNFNLEGLPDGTYTLTVTATDQAGNSSTGSYTWTVDQTPPTVITEPPSPTNLSTASFGFNEPVTYTYSLDGGTSSSGTGSAIPLPGLTEDEHTITIISATDLAGNPMTEPYDYSWITDYGPPTVTLSGGPPSPTNKDFADFSVSSSEPVTYTYTLDGSPAFSTSLSGLSEGPHTFSVIATDQAENTSIESYSWTADYTEPALSITPVAASPETGTTATVTIELESSEQPVTYSYNLNGGDWTVPNPSLIIPDVPEGSNILEVQATDAAGNPSSTEELSFDLSRYSLTGSFYGCIGEVFGGATGEVAGVKDQDWGGWEINMTGEGNNVPNEEWTLYAGGRSSDDIQSNNYGYWLLIADGSTDYDSQILSGSSTFKYLSHDRFGLGEGVLSGSYFENDYYEYTLKDIGSGTYTETPLAFSGYLGGESLYHNEGGYFSYAGYDYGLIGLALRPDNNYDLLTIGEYNDYGYGTAYLWNSDFYADSVNGDGQGRVIGFSGGIWKNGTMDGAAAALYIDIDGNAGYLTGDIAGSYYPNIIMWMSEGTLSPTQRATGLNPEDFQTEWGSLDAHLFGDFDGIGSIEGWTGYGETYAYGETLFFVEDSESLPWGIYNLKLGDGNTYSDKPEGETNWSAMVGGQGTFDYEGNSGYWLAEIEGTWSDDGEIRGDLVNGKYLTPIQMGTIGGPFFGKSDASGTWIGESLGTWSGEPLAFGGNLNSGLFQWDQTFWSVVDGGFTGLMGVAEIEGSPSFLSLGTYNTDYETNNLYNGALWGVDILDSTPDNGALLGFTGGIVLGDNLESLLAGIFIKDNGETGYIYSDNVTGNLYPEIGMYELGGNLTAVTRGTTTVLPSQLYWGSKSLESDEWPFFNIAGGINGEVSGSDIKLEEADKTHQEWGIWRFTATGSYTDEPEGQWNAVGGYVGYDDEDESVHGYKIYHFTEGSWSSGRLSANMTGRHIHISPDSGNNTVVEIGRMLGTYDDGTWKALGAGYYEELDLTFGGGLGNESFEWDTTYYLVGVRSLTGLIGATESLWTGTPSFLSLGTYDIYNLYDGALWGVDVSTNIPGGFISDGGALLGVKGGIALSDNEIRDSLVGGLRAIYIRSTDTEEYEAGFFISDNVNGYLYPEIGMYELDGNLATVPMGMTSVSPSDLYWGSESLYAVKETGTVEGDITGSIAIEHVNLINQPWAIWWASSVGSYTNPPSTGWTVLISSENFEEGYIRSAITTVNQLSDISFTGSTTGYLADIRSDPFTAISVGEVFGTFDPAAYTWQAVSMGIGIETNKFLEMAATPEGMAKLNQMNIPCVEVGRATLTGSGNNFTNLNMTDTIFFAPNSGAKPTIWATGNVGGTYTAPPTLDSPIGLSSGSGLNAAFTFKTWDSGSGKWLSTVNGTGGFNGSTSFQGAGAGTGATSGSGTIKEGTAAGVAK